MEDYDSGPREYLKDIFSFLELDMPVDDEEWATIIGPAVKNQHRVERQPMLAETKSLLEQFYRPYNILLARALKDRRFLWGDTHSLREDAHGPSAHLAKEEEEEEEEDKEEEEWDLAVTTVGKKWNQVISESHEIFPLTM